jgi:diaminopimelate decarboxylase
VITIKRAQTTFVAVDGGMGDNLEVALFDQRFGAGIANRLDASNGEVVTVVGRHCESGDILVDGVPRVMSHERRVFLGAGAQLGSL